MSLERRRMDEKRMKKRAERKVRLSSLDNSVPDAKAIGKSYTTHGNRCSCYMCCNPRSFNQKTLDEIRNEDRIKELELDSNEMSW